MSICSELTGSNQINEITCSTETRTQSIVTTVSHCHCHVQRWLSICTYIIKSKVCIFMGWLIDWAWFNVCTNTI